MFLSCNQEKHDNLLSRKIGAKLVAVNSTSEATAINAPNDKAMKITSGLCRGLSTAVGGRTTSTARSLSSMMSLTGRTLLLEGRRNTSQFI